MLKIAVKGWPLIARNNGTDVAIRPDQHPSAWFKAIAAPNMSTVVNDISTRTVRVDAQTGACWYSCRAIYLIPQQSPVWTPKEIEQAGTHSRRAANWCIR